ncbi:MAG: hypothetical protein WAO55_11460 [Candidatus Manganitrophaceae bacterium]
MHAAFPCFTPSLHRVMRVGSDAGGMPRWAEAAGGTVLANGIAALLKFGFGYVMRDCLVSEAGSKKGMAFFNENFVFTDPQAPGGRRYYQGQFLIRTRRAGDEMNVWLRFCPKPEALFKQSFFGRILDPLAVVVAEALDESEAERIEKDPSRVDLVIRFKDVASIIGLVGRPSVDIVGLLLENTVQLTGNVGHLFKLGALAKNVESALDLPKAPGENRS